MSSAAGATSRYLTSAQAPLKTIRNFIVESAQFQTFYQSHKSAVTKPLLSPRIAFVGCTFRNLSIPDSEFLEMFFTKCRFEGVIFRGCKFKKGSFNQSEFIDCNFHDANFDDMDVQGATFRKCILTSAKFIRCDARATSHIEHQAKSDMKHVQKNTTFYGCNMAHATFIATRARHAIFANCIISDGSFAHSNLTNATIRGCNIEGTTFEQAEMKDIYVEIDKNQRNICPRLINTVIINESLKTMAPRSKRLTKDALIERLEQHVLWRQSRKAQGERAIFDDVDLSGLNIPEIDLSEASFRGANLSKTNFRQCLFVNADFSDANTAGTNFQAANLTNAMITEEQLARAEIAEAIIPSGDRCSGDLNDPVWKPPTTFAQAFA